MNGNNRSLQAEGSVAASRPPGRHQPHTPGQPEPRTSSLLMLIFGRVGNAITERIAATKRRLLEGGRVAARSSGAYPASPDMRGRRVFTYYDARRADRAAAQRSTVARRFSTDRADNTVLTILDPLSITDEHIFSGGAIRFTSYKIKAIDGISFRTKKPASGLPAK